MRPSVHDPYIYKKLIYRLGYVKNDLDISRSTKRPITDFLELLTQGNNWNRSTPWQESIEEA